MQLLRPHFNIILHLNGSLDIIFRFVFTDVKKDEDRGKLQTNKDKKGK